MAEVRKGPVAQPGGAEQLPQGAAAAVNPALQTPDQSAAAPSAPAQQGQQVPVPGPSPVSYAQPGTDGTEGFQPTGDNEDIMFADHPNGPQPVILSRPDQRPVPTSVVRHLPMMRAALQDPGAPDALKAMYRIVIDKLQQEYGSQGNQHGG